MAVISSVPEGFNLYVNGVIARVPCAVSKVDQIELKPARDKYDQIMYALDCLQAQTQYRSLADSVKKDLQQLVVENDQLQISYLEKIKYVSFLWEQLSWEWIETEKEKAPYGEVVLIQRSGMQEAELGQRLNVEPTSIQTWITYTTRGCHEGTENVIRWCRIPPLPSDPKASAPAG